MFEVSLHSFSYVKCDEVDFVTRHCVLISFSFFLLLCVLVYNAHIK